MNIPLWLLRLLPMWDYICPKCKKEVEKNSHKCPFCGERYGVPLRVPPKILKDAKALEKYVHEKVFPRISASQREYLTRFFTVLFSDGFESGDFSAWTGTIVTSGNTLEVITGAKYTGSYGAHSVATAYNDTALCYKTFGSTYTTLYVRIYLYIVQFNFTSGYADSIIQIVNNTGTIIESFGIYNDAGTLRPAIRDYSDSSWTYTGSMTTGTWYCFEAKTVCASGTGELRLYLDGIDTVDETGINNPYTPNQVNCGQNAGFGGHSGTVEIYYDDVVVADAYIGPISTAVSASGEADITSSGQGSVTALTSVAGTGEVGIQSSGLGIVTTLTSVAGTGESGISSQGTAQVNPFVPVEASFSAGLSSQGTATVKSTTPSIIHLIRKRIGWERYI